MATKVTETRHLYSWWWDSHISPKNSKWLQENLTDTDGKVKAMIKIINEDADSFAKRAEMYYKKRPELMKLVEDFYRAYRALAERYDHATGELRLAHRTMIEAFPNQMPDMLSDEPNSSEMFQSGESTLRELKTAESRLRQGDDDAKDSCFKLDLKTMILNESDRALKVEAEMQSLRLALASVQAERDSVLSQYNQISEKLLTLEKDLCSAQKTSAMEEKLEVVCKQNVEAETEIKALKEEISRLSQEKEDAYIRYQQCMEMIAKLQRELMEAKEELMRLKGAENQCVLLEEVNQSLKVEANDLVQEIAEKDKKLMAKHDELEVLMMRLRDEEARFLQVENELNTLQKMHLRSQKDAELEIEGLKLATCAAGKEMKHEILGLKEIKERLEIEVKRQEEQNEGLQEQFSKVKQELECSGIDPNCINSSIKDLQNENLRMKQKSDEANAEKEALLKRLYDVKFELESCKEKMKAFQEYCSTLGGEKASLIAEKSALLSQLQIITESMQKLLEKNVSLETSLHCANIELEGLKVKSKGLEDFVQFLKDEKSNLQSERNSLVYRLERLETRFTKLENKYFDLEKARDSARDQVQELKISLACETRLIGLENRIHQLQEGNCEDQVEKAVSAQVEIFMLKKIMKDMEERDSSLLAECHRHVEAAKFSEKLISELESEYMMQHLEIEYLLDRIEILRRGICQVLKAVDIDHVKIDPEIKLPHVCRKLTENKDESHELLIQNNVLSTVIKEMSADAVRSNWFLLEKLAKLEEEKRMLKEENTSANREVLSLSNQSVVLKNSWIQTVLELENLKEGFRDLGEKMVIRESENIQLREEVQKMEEKNMELSVCNDELNKQCLVEKVHCKTQEKEVVLLRKAKGNLENEVSVLAQQIESCKTRELLLNSKLHEISSEFEKWEVEATSFYSDLHMSSVREALLEDKVQELSGLCGDLQKVEARRSMEIERLNKKISFLESDREGLKSNLAAYLPGIASLKENIASLEQTQTKACCLATPQLQDAMDQSCSVSDGLSELQELQRRVKAIKNSLQDTMQTKIKLAKQKSRNNSQPNPIVQSRSREVGAGTSEPRNGIHMKDIPLDHVSASPSTIRRRKSSRLSDQMLELWEASDMDSSQNLPLYKSQPRSSPPRRKRSDSNGGGIEKELGVDKLELSKNVTTESKQGGNRKIILERLASDAQKLAALQNSVQELKTKMEANKRSKTAKNIEFKSVKSKIYNVESSVMQLVSMNTELTKTIKGSASSSLDFARSRELVEVEQALRRKMIEQTRRDSERIGSLQQEMEKMQSMVVKMEDDNCKKINEISKGSKNGLLRTRTGIILREFVYGPSRSRKQKKPRFCGCFKQSHKQV